MSKNKIIITPFEASLYDQLIAMCPVGEWATIDRPKLWQETKSSKWMLAARLRSLAKKGVLEKKGAKTVKVLVPPEQIRGYDRRRDNLTPREHNELSGKTKGDQQHGYSTTQPNQQAVHPEQGAGAIRQAVGGS